MAFTQLDPPIPLDVIGKGKGLAIGMIDYGPEYNLIWVTAIDETGEIWCAPNPKVRMQQNWTLGRPKPLTPIVGGEHLCKGEELMVVNS